MKGIQCLFFDGIPLTEEMRTAFFLAARAMLESNAGKANLQNGGVACGQIWTKGQRRTLGSLSGIEFRAIVEMPHGDVRCRYLVRDFDTISFDELTSGRIGLRWTLSSNISEAENGAEW